MASTGAKKKKKMPVVEDPMALLTEKYQNFVTYVEERVPGFDAATARAMTPTMVVAAVRANLLPHLEAIQARDAAYMKEAAEASSDSAILEVIDQLAGDEKAWRYMQLFCELVA